MDIMLSQVDMRTIRSIAMVLPHYPGSDDDVTVDLTEYGSPICNDACGLLLASAKDHVAAVNLLVAMGADPDAQ